jgi:protein tyrosine phosphatase (PTP) superfamily phosphohydrolase (DUF442 family)
MSFGTRGLIGLILCSLPVFAGNAPGIGNFDQVDVHVYRGAQPSDAGIQYLAKLGVRTVIDLREAGGRAEAERQVVTRAGMTYVNVPMSGLTPPSEAEITRVLTILEDTTTGPVFVHCKRGADRTGSVIAAYRIDFSKWDNGRALAEAKAHHMSGFQFPRMAYIRNFRPHIARATTTAPASAAPAIVVPATALPAAAASAAGSK